jgi:hypothetical protein
MSKVGYRVKESEEREATELEELLQTKFVGRGGDPYPAEIGKHVSVDVGGSTRVGVYRGMTEKGNLILIPSINNEFDNTDRKFSFIETERPQYISHSAVKNVDPISEKFFLKMGSNYTLAKEQEMSQTFSDGGGL